MTENTKNKLSTDARSLGWAGIAAFVACAACCAIPLLAAAGVGGAGAATFASVVGGGSELIVGAVVFMIVLGALVARARAKRNQSCGAACAADGTCCDRGVASRNA